MFKIDGAGTVPAMPARGAVGAVPGWFNQTPGTSPGTVVTAEWLNMMQAEILSVIAAAGIAPDKPDDSQLLKALQKLMKSIVPTGTRTGFTGRVAPSGWVLGSGRTIGDASSGATERANADTRDLFVLLWTDYANADLPIQTSGGVASVRGATAAADFDAHKRLPVPNYSNRAGFGRGDMSGVDAALITVAGSGVDGRVLGRVGGVQAKTFAFTGTTDVDTGGVSAANGGQSTASSPHAHGVSGNTTLASILNPMIVETVIIKL